MDQDNTQALPAPDGSQPATSMPPEVFAYAKTLFPGAPDSAVISGYEQIRKVLLAGGTDLAKVPPAAQVQLIKQQAEAGQKYKAAAPADPAAAASPDGTAQLQPVTVTGKLPTPAANPPVQAPEGGNFGTGPAGVVAPAASTNAMFNDQGPTGQRLAYTDPALLKAAADKEYALSGRDNLGGRFLGAIAAGTAGGSGGQGGAYQTYNDKLADIDKAHNTGLVAAQDLMARNGTAQAASLATTNQANATAAQEMAQKAKQFGSEQAIRDNTAGLSQQDTANKLRLGDPNDPTAAAALAIATPLLHSLGYDPKHFDGMSASAINQFIESSKPTTELQQKLKSQSQTDYANLTGRISAVAGAALTGEQTGAAHQSNQTTGAVTGATTSGAGPSAAVIKQNVRDSGLVYTPPNMGVNPGDNAIRTGGGDAVVNLRKGVQGYDNTGVGTATDTALQALQVAGLKDTGVPGSYLKNIPTSQAQAIKTALVGHQMAANPGMDANVASSNADTFMKNGTRKELIQQLAQGKATQAANKSIVLPAMEAYQHDHGSLTGFVPPVVQKFFNPMTGKTLTSTDPNAAKSLPKGYVPITGGQ